MTTIKLAEEKFPDSAEAAQLWFCEQWSNAVQHLTAGNCHPRCRQGTCIHINHDPATTEPHCSEKNWFDPMDPKLKLVQAIADAITLRVKEFVHHPNTCTVESAHRWRVAQASKSIDYWATFAGRCYMTIVYHYLGPMAIVRMLEWAGIPITPEERAYY